MRGSLDRVLTAKFITLLLLGLSGCYKSNTSLAGAQNPTPVSQSERPENALKQGDSKQALGQNLKQESEYYDERDDEEGFDQNSFNQNGFQPEPKEPREYISDNVASFSTGSEWEGVWGQVSQCDPRSGIGWCYKQSALQIYSCYQTRQYNYEQVSAVCRLGIVLRQIPDSAKPTEHLTCDSSSFPGEVEILIDGNKAVPGEEYFELVCGDTQGAERQKCEKNMSFSLSLESGLESGGDSANSASKDSARKDSGANASGTNVSRANARGVRFHSSKGLDSSVCETPSDRSRAGSLSGFYPRFRGSFDCQKDGLSKVERGVCNSFYTQREDVSMNVMFEYAMNFASDSQKAALKKEQLAWIKERNIACNGAADGNELFKCIYGKTNSRIEQLREVIERLPGVELELVSAVAAVKIYEEPSVKSSVIYTKILQILGGENNAQVDFLRDYLAILLEPKPRNGFSKIMLMELSRETNPNQNAIVGYVQNANIKRDKGQ